MEQGCYSADFKEEDEQDHPGELSQPSAPLDAERETRRKCGTVASDGGRVLSQGMQVVRTQTGIKKTYCPLSV